MRAACLAALAVALAGGCARPGPPPATPPDNVVVDLGPRLTQVQLVAPQSAPPPPLRASLDVCIDRFRDARGLKGDTSRAGRLYRTGLGAERTGDLITASSAYSQLIERHPDSPFAPLAFLGMASMLEAAGQTGLAANKYRLLLKTLKARHPVHRYARYRRGMLDLKRQDYIAAMGDLKAAIEGTPAPHDELCAPEIVHAALQAYVICYVATGRPEMAHDSLKPLSGDIGAGHAHTVDLMVTLASRYVADNQPSEAAIVLIDTLQRYQPLRRQCASIARLVDHLYEPAFPTMTALAALEAQTSDRCDDSSR